MKSTKLILFCIIMLASLLSACRKHDFTHKSEKEKATEKFFQLPESIDVEIIKIAEDLKKQNVMLNSLSVFANKNGFPRWDKVHYKTVQQPAPLSRALSDTTGTQGVFLIPLQAANTPEIISYITCYKHNDSTYTYRLYNKDSLEHLQAQPDSLKANW